MPLQSKLSRAGLLLALGACAIAAFVDAGSVDAGQRTGKLHVSVQVVDSCSSQVGAGGGNTYACAGATVPIAVVREQSADGAAPPPQSAGPVDRTARVASQAQQEEPLIALDGPPELGRRRVGQRHAGRSPGGRSRQDGQGSIRLRNRLASDHARSLAGVYGHLKHQAGTDR